MADDGGGFFDVDPNQPGALTGSPNLSPGDPLYDWAQKAAQISPQDMHQFVYDPQGATQNLINKGVQPPDHHYDSMGNAISADDAAKLDVAKQAAKQQLGQNLTAQFGVNPPPGSGMSRAAAPLGMVSPAGPPGQPYAPDPNAPEPQVGKGPSYAVPPVPPAPPPQTGGATGGWTAPPQQTGGASGSFAPADKRSIAQRARDALTPTQTPAGATQTPAGATQAPAAAGPPMFKPPEAKVATNQQAEQFAREYEAEKEARKAQLQTPESEAAAEKKKKKEKTDEYSDALEGFSKSLSGIKVPQRPPLPAPGTPSVRSPVGVTPNVQQLLGLAGQPGGVPTALARLQALLGRSLT